MSVNLVDPDLAPAVAGENGWEYQQRASADLDGDGTAETLVLTARAEMYRGRPAWDDGQPWQVYVTDEGGTRTYLYARRLQLGTLTARITTDDGQGRSSVLLVEHLPDRFAVYETIYGGPGEAASVVRLERVLDPSGEISAPPFP